jgi:nitrogenase molybdenum-iron protein NifN
VAPVSQPSLRQLPVEKVVHWRSGGSAGFAVRYACRPAGGQLPCRDLAEQFSMPLVRAGFPIFDRLGEFRRVRQGYPGMRDTLFELANLMRERHHHLPTTARRCASNLPGR